jgi:hypothetical protein
MSKARFDRRQRRSSQMVVSLIALGALAMLAAACGPGSAAPNVASIGSTTTTTSAAGTALSGGNTDLQQAYQAQLGYAQCMRTHGEPSFPDPTLTAHSVSFGGGNIDQHSQQFISASTTCKRLVPDGGPPSAAQMQASIARLLKNAECMRAHGITNFPDPVVSARVVGISLKGLDPNSPQFQAAQKACQKLAPLGGVG